MRPGAAVRVLGTNHSVKPVARPSTGEGQLRTFDARTALLAQYHDACFGSAAEEAYSCSAGRRQELVLLSVCAVGTYVGKNVGAYLERMAASRRLTHHLHCVSVFLVLVHWWACKNHGEHRRHYNCDSTLGFRFPKRLHWRQILIPCKHHN